jgi:hypothetical protein
MSSSFTRKVLRAWARDPRRPSQCTCRPRPMRWPEGEVVLEHREWCGLRRQNIRQVDGPATSVVLSVRGADYGEGQ